MKNWIYYFVVIWLLGKVVLAIADEAHDEGFEHGKAVEHAIHTAPVKDGV